MLKEWLLIENGILTPKENIDKDRELFDTFSFEDKPILRLYQWEEGFSYGVSQNIDELDIDFGYYSAKRITGGGILLHGHDISYSIITAIDNENLKFPKRSYEFLCGFVLDFYRSLGLEAKFAKDYENIELSKSQYCQVGFEPYDILIDGKKIGGNAQKRAKDKLLQHGSIPIKKLFHPLAGYSLEDFGVHIAKLEAKELLKFSFQKRFDIRFTDE